jgi:hypothetical protein
MKGATSWLYVDINRNETEIKTSQQYQQNQVQIEHQGNNL